MKRWLYGVLLVSVSRWVAFGRPLPVIVDTSIGDDFDDSWALAQVLTDSQAWDVRMVLTATRDTVKRAQIVAKYLTLYNRTDIPIGIGIQTDDYCGAPLADWAKDMDLDKYVAAGGTVYRDGLGAVVQMLEGANPGHEISIIGNAPMTNLGALVQQFPSAASRVPAVYAMFGGVNYCYNHVPVGPGGCKEFHVFQNTTASQNFMRGPWKIVITPLDTCEYRMDPAPWSRMLATNDSSHPFNNVLLTTFSIWANGQQPRVSNNASDVLYDSVAVLLSATMSPFQMETVPLVVHDDGSLVRDPQNGVPVDCAVAWHGDAKSIFWDKLASAIIDM